MIYRLGKVTLAVCLAGLALQAHAAAPLLQEGKQTLYQRVLTTPSCQLGADSTATSGKQIPAFSRLYVYERQEAEGRNMLKVGPDSLGKTIGWLDQACTVDWKMQLTLAFTNPANRDRLLFFKSRETLEDILDAPDPAEYAAPLRQELKKNGQAEGVLAQEPELFVDMQQQFYLLPVLQGEEIMTDAGFRARVLNIASVSEATSQEPVQPEQTEEEKKAAQISAFSAAVVFVIDTTISMDPYIDSTRKAIREVYEKIEQEGLGNQVKFGLVAFRSSVEAAPGVEYVSRMYADPNTVVDGADFLSKVAEVKQASVSTVAYDEDAYAGVLHAIDKVDWSGFGARYIVLITDAGALEGSSPHSSTGLDAAQLRIEAANPGVAIYTLHLKTPSGTTNHAKAEAQYRDLSTYAGTNASLYYPVNAGDVKQYQHMIGSLADAIAGQVRSAYLGEDAVGSAVHAKAQPEQDEVSQQMLEDAAQIGHAMRLAYLGKISGAQAPAVFEAWISDRDLVRQSVPTTDVRVLLTKAQLSDLSDVVKRILEAANEGLISPTDMFSRLRSVAATMGTDPSKIKSDDSTKLAELGILGEYLEDLPYQSAVLSLDEQTWASWDALSQERFMRDLGVKLRHYQRYNADSDRWISLAENADASEDVYPVPLEMMP